MIIMLIIISTVKHMPGDIWVGWEDGWEHHEFDSQTGNVTIVNHSGIDVGMTTSQYTFNRYDILTISSLGKWPDIWNARGVGYDSAYYWYYAWTSNGSGRNRLDIYYISGYPGHYYNRWDIINWVKQQVGKSYNYNLFNWNHDVSFYCHQLVYRAFLNVAGIILDDGDDWPPTPGRIIEALDLVHSEQSRSRTINYNFTLTGELPPEPPKEPIEALTVNVLSELEGKYQDISQYEFSHFEGAIYGLFKASERRLYEGEEPNYDEILSFLNQAIDELRYIPRLHGIRGKVISIAHRIMNDRAKGTSKEITLLKPENEEGFFIKTENFVRFGILKIDINLIEEGDFEYRIIDVSGRTRRSGKFCSMSKGRHNITINLDNLPDGTYILNMKTGNNEKTEKITIAR